jgi:hypothetical protein
MREAWRAAGYVTGSKSPARIIAGSMTGLSCLDVYGRCSVATGLATFGGRGHNCRAGVGQRHGRARPGFIPKALLGDS